MLTLFNVNELNFLNDDGDKDRLRFIPSKGLELNYTKWDILQRIFTEDIIVNPDTPAPEYPAIIQQLINADPQPTTAAQIAQILSLYNPSDISEIIRQLIDANPQPTTREEVAQNVYAYPYELYSAIYDYLYLAWGKIGTGNIVRNDDETTFENAGVQYQNLTKTIATNGLSIIFTVKITQSLNTPLIYLYNSLVTASNAFPLHSLRYDGTAEEFVAASRFTTGGSIYRVSFQLGKNFKPSTYQIEYRIRTDGTTYCSIQNLETSVKDYGNQSTTSTSFEPKHIRICANSSSASPLYATGVTIQKLKITDANNTIVYSRWNK